MALLLTGRFLLLLLACACALGAGITWVVLDGTFTGNVIQEASSSYTWTTAICNSHNQCIDVLVECERGKVVGLTPISAITSFADEWEDIRDTPVVFCE
jgi:arginine/ornithine N-succinyltransferase beta subunit